MPFLQNQSFSNNILSSVDQYVLAKTFLNWMEARADLQYIPSSTEWGNSNSWEIHLNFAIKDSVICHRLRIYKILNFFHWICIVYWGLLLANCRVSHGPKLWLGQKSFNTQQVLTRQESGGSPCNHMLAEKSTSMSTSFAPLVYICCSKDSSYSLWWLAAMGHLKSFPLMWN